MHPVLGQQLAALSAGDIEALVGNYATDAVLVRFDGVFAGTERIRGALTAYLALRPGLVRLLDYAEHDDTVFYRAIMSVGGQRREATGTLVIRDGRIWRQTAG
ncbi:nuclear transport factor 2 family protein [Streptomyces luteireticuli]|uniref:nuclear transport factor 2 family protein n=1 Tax=Streptomyces luteireticuli TaxID=173858 RepID=UPI003558F67C